MKLTPEERTAYLAWQKALLEDLPATMDCPECDGSGRTECGHCGSEIDCEDCDAAGEISAEEFLSVELFRRERIYEEARLALWQQGAPLPLKDGKYPLLEDPLAGVLEWFDEYREPQRILLSLPVTG